MSETAKRDGRDLLAAAAEAARSGRFPDAMRLAVLAEQAGGVAQDELLDLQARIYAQQGLYADAADCWRRARTINPHNPDYELGLTRLARGASWLPLTARTALASLALVLTVLVLWQSLWMLPRMQRQQMQVASSLEGLSASAVRIEDESRAAREELAGRLALGAEELAGLRSMIALLDTTSTQVAGDIRELGDAVAAAESGVERLRVRMRTRDEALDARLTSLREPLFHVLASTPRATQVDSLAAALADLHALVVGACAPGRGPQGPFEVEVPSRGGLEEVPAVGRTP